MQRQYCEPRGDLSLAHSLDFADKQYNGVWRWFTTVSTGIALIPQR